MNYRLLLCSMALTALAPIAGAQTVVRPDAKITNTSFAVITDPQTWKAAEAEIREYASALADEGLPAFIVYDNWSSPEVVKKVIRNLHSSRKLEGVVFVGDVPVPMIRKAQHLTSAFKMDENAHPFIESSVPSDRFYDDFHLKFDFIRRDSVSPLFYYYNLAADSPQQIKCDIYSARIKAIDNGEDKNEQIRKYFRKAVAEHKAANKLDQFFSYMGEGSYSNSLTAWTQEAQTIREQMPGTFDSPVSPGRARFMRYSFSDYPKEDIISMLRRADLDLAIFHEHGMPHRMYLSGIPEVENLNDAVDIMRAGIRYRLQRCDGDTAKIAKAIAEYKAKGMNPEWWEGYDSPEFAALDSVNDLKRGIVLADVTDFRPNSRMVIFDACYNGDFREPDNIASRFIFADGRTVATFANSVNVLQDKMANELLGMLWLGCRVGQWAQETNILESHIIGDPTFRFTPSLDGVDGAEICSRPYSAKDNERLLASGNPEIRSLALHRAWRHGEKGLSDKLLDTYRTSPYIMERYAAFSLLHKLGDSNFETVLADAVTDPNEFIRRKAVNYMGRVGREEYLPLLVDTYYNDQKSARVAFNVECVIRAFSDKAFDSALSARTDTLAQSLRRAYKRGREASSTILDKNSKKRWRILYANGLRNDNIQADVPDYLKIIEDENDDEEVRVALIQALAWYDKSCRRDEILSVCDRLRKKSSSKAIKEEANRTYYRLK